MGTVTLLIQLSPGALLNLNVAEHHLKMTPIARRPVEATTADCCHAVENLATGDRRLKVLEIATEVGISYGSVLNILHEHLGLSKVCA